MISKSMSKRKPLVSQKVRRRWVIAYFVAFGFMFFVSALDLDFLFEHNLSWSWVLIGGSWLAVVLYIFASVRGLSMFHKSEY